MLAVCVLDDVDLEVSDDGVRVDRVIDLPWDEVEYALSPHDPDSAAAISATRAWVRTRLHLARWSPTERLARVRPVALPVGHALHPGPLWAREQVSGGALDVGLGIRGVGPNPEEVVVLDPMMLAGADADHDLWWDRANSYRADMAAYAIERHARDPLATLRSIGDCDVPTLLSCPAFRQQLASEDTLGMRSAAVPTRTHGWLDLGRIDPAFAVAAASAVEPPHRGFPRPILITGEEISQVRDGGRHFVGASDATAGD